MGHNHIEERVFSLQYVNGMPPITNMDRHQLNEHFRKFEKEIQNRRRFFDDCFAHSSDIRFQILTRRKIPDSKYPYFMGMGSEELPVTNIALRVRSRQDGRWLLIPTKHAWRQILSDLDFPKGLFNKLLQEENPQLLTENLNFLLGRLDSQDFLLRMISPSEDDVKKARSGGDAKPFLLRAFLTPRFCRMDNVYLCDAMKKALESLKEEISDIKFSLEWDNGDMLIDVQLLRERTLTKLNEKYVSGIRLIASEIGSYEHISVQTMLKRLVCLNGMTVDEKDKIARIRYYSNNHKMGMDRFQNLPSFPMDEKFSEQQKEIEERILAIVRACHEKTDMSLKQFEERVDRFLRDAEKDKEPWDKEKIKAALKYMLRWTTGLPFVRNVDLEKVFQYYETEYEEMEKAAKEHEPSVAWALINAVTRYAAYRAMNRDLHLAQTVQSRIHSHILNPAHIKWDNIREYANSNKNAKTDDYPPVPV